MPSKQFTGLILKLQEHEKQELTVALTSQYDLGWSWLIRIPDLEIRMFRSSVGVGDHEGTERQQIVYIQINDRNYPDPNMSFEMWQDLAKSIILHGSYWKRISFLRLNAILLSLKSTQNHLLNSLRSLNKFIFRWF